MLVLSKANFYLITSVELKKKKIFDPYLRIRQQPCSVYEGGRCNKLSPKQQ